MCMQDVVIKRGSKLHLKVLGIIEESKIDII